MSLKLKYKIKETQDIKLIICNPLPLLKALENENFSKYGVKEIVIQDDQNRTKIPWRAKLRGRVVSTNVVVQANNFYIQS